MPLTENINFEPCTVAQLCNVVNKSSKVNSARPYMSLDVSGDVESESNFKLRESEEFFKLYLRNLRGIICYYHLRFTKDDPGAVHVKKNL